MPGLAAIRSGARTALSYQIARPLACLVLQGSKQVTMGRQAFTFKAGESLLKYARMFGLPPVRDAHATQQRLQAA